MSGLPSKFNFNCMVKFFPICQHMLDAFKLMPCSTYFLPASTFGLLPGLAAHFCFLLRHGVRYIAHALSLLRWQLYACKTQHVFVLSQGHTANSVTSIFGSLQFEFGSMVYISTSVHVKKKKKNCSRTLNHLWQLICSWSFF